MGTVSWGGLEKFMHGKCLAHSLHTELLPELLTGVVSRSLLRGFLCLFQRHFSDSPTPTGILQFSSVLTLPTFL